MNNGLIITIEILVCIVAPLLLLYLRGNWPMRSIIPSVTAIPLLWYLTYALFHEVCHAIAIYLLGGTITDYKLVPHFWEGEFGRAWIQQQGLDQTWEMLLMSSSPYLVDAAGLAAAPFLLRKTMAARPFLLGLLFMFLCLRAAFDIVCETIGLLQGGRGDFYNIQQSIGAVGLWCAVTLMAVLIAVSCGIILKRFGKPPLSPA